jgi:uncharacterized protein involved in response to NO
MTHMATNPPSTPSPDSTLLWHGTALFNLGFRPFYLLAALLAALGLPLWVMQYFGALPAPRYAAGMAWHAHEMVFGFAAAVITGFLFTAARSWTGLPTPVHGGLASLALLWLLGRLLMATGPAWLAASVDVAFLVAVAVALWFPLQRSRNRNRFFVGLLLLFAGANLAFHLAHAGALGMDELVPVRFALYLVIVIVMIMAGRVTPSFTQNAIPTARIGRSRALDLSAIGSAALALAAFLASLPDWIVAPLCLFAGGLHAARLWLWDPLCTRGVPILWILHLSYAWIPVGLVLMGLSTFTMVVPAVLADHALSAGAVSGMIIGMITRTARGHTGRPLRASLPETVAYLLVHVAAALRVLLPLAWPAAYGWAVSASGALWSAAFLLYLFVYAPILTQPRIDLKPG